MLRHIHGPPPSALLWILPDAEEGSDGVVSDPTHDGEPGETRTLYGRARSASRGDLRGRQGLSSAAGRLATPPRG